MAEHTAPTAAVLLIGDEILSGRTKDRNLGYIADYMTALGIDLKEARVVADDESEIADAVNALRSKYTYVFTTGGIGPTHDDITADSVARAFGVTIDHDPRAVEILKAWYAEIGREVTPARMRMARIPEGAELIENPISKAPGIHIGNVFVMAGIPKVMHAMLDAVAPKLQKGAPVLSRSVSANIGEGDIGGPLKEIQERFPEVTIGSYPFEVRSGFGSNIVVRSRDKRALDVAFADVEAMIEDLRKAGKETT